MMAKIRIFGQKQEFPNVKALAPIDRKSAFLFLRENGMSDQHIADVYSVSLEAVLRVIEQPPLRLKAREKTEVEVLPAPQSLVFDRKARRHFAVLQLMVERRCRISQVAIADRLHISESEVRTSLDKLVADGLIVKAERTVRNQPDKYSLTEKGVIFNAEQVSSDIEIVPSPLAVPVLKRVQHARSAPIFRVLAAFADAGPKGKSRTAAGLEIGMRNDSVAHHCKSLMRRGWIEQLRAHQGTKPGVFAVTGPGFEALEDAI